MLDDLATDRSGRTIGGLVELAARWGAGSTHVKLLDRDESNKRLDAASLATIAIGTVPTRCCGERAEVLSRAPHTPTPHRLAGHITSGESEIRARVATITPRAVVLVVETPPSRIDLAALRCLTRPHTLG